MTIDKVALNLIGRAVPLFSNDINSFEAQLSSSITNNRFLVIGGAGSIGQSVTKELFKRNPQALHVVDISENNLVELVRDIRSTIGYIDGDFKTFAIDCGSIEFESLMNTQESYDYIFNLSALKHVRSEKDKFTLMRMVNVNILNTIKTSELTKKTLSKMMDNEGLYTNDDVNKNDSWEWDTGKEKESLDWLL